MSKQTEEMLDQLSYEQMLEIATWLCAITREQVKDHILEYDFTEEEIREALEAININPDELE